MKSGRRLKFVTVLAGLALAGLALLASTQTWIQIRASSPNGGTVSIASAGNASAPALSALAFAGLALFGAITIAGPFFRVILALLQIVLGAAVVVAALLVIGDPVAAASAAISKVTGVDGDKSVAASILSRATTFWPWTALAVGIAMVVLGVFVAITGSRWPAATRRYQAVRFVSPDALDDPVVTWDTLTLGSDPTATTGEERGPRPPVSASGDDDAAVSPSEDARSGDDTR